MDKDVNNLIQNALQSIKQIIDSNTIVGKPISVDNCTIIPITKVNVGFVAGGGELASKIKVKNLPFAGASTSGFSLSPVGFVCINSGVVSYYNIDCNVAGSEVLNIANKIINKVLENDDEKE